jgi:hypothetical protein
LIENKNLWEYKSNHKPACIDAFNKKQLLFLFVTTSFHIVFSLFVGNVDLVISRHRANCPKCGKELVKPDKTIENSVFCVARFTCDSCGTIFKYSTEF